MKTYLKKVVSIALSISLLCSFSASAIAANDKSVSADRELEKAILTVKERIAIPDECTEFTFSSNKNFGQKDYSLSWQNVEGDKYVNINITGDVITNYNCNSNYVAEYEYNRGSDARFAKLSKAKLLKMAKENIKKINPTVSSKIIIDEDSYYSYLRDSEASFHMYRYENGIKVENDSGMITLNKDTGELISFYFEWTNETFKKPDNIKTQSEIQKIYKNNSDENLKLRYNIVSDWETKSKYAVLQYVGSAATYNAFTGKFPTGTSEYSANPATGMAEMPATDEPVSDSYDRGLTKKEQQKVELIKDLLTAEDALKIIIYDQYNEVNDNFKLTSSYLTTDYYDINKYTWSITAEYRDPTGDENYSLNAEIDAENGDIKQLYLYNKNEPILYSEFDIDFVQKRADDAIKSYLGSKFDEYKLNESEQMIEKNIYTEMDEKGNLIELINTSIYFSYTRYVNDIPTTNTIGVSLTPSGMVTSFHYSYDNIKFEEPKNILSKSDVYKNLFIDREFVFAYNVKYDYTKSVTNRYTELVYFLNNFYMNAFTGEFTNYKGDVKVENDNSAYSDLGDNAISKIALKLSENGININKIDGKLAANKKITKDDYITLLESIYSDWGTYDFYRTTLKKEADTPKENITLRESLEIFIDLIGAKDVMKYTELFTSPFGDVENDDKLVGYFAYANARGIIKADTKGNINPDEFITRGDALTMVYRYILENS